MLKRINLNEKEYRDGVLILPLGGNHDVVNVRICTNGEFQSEVVIKYAQNGITSELLTFGRKTSENGRELVRMMRRTAQSGMRMPASARPAVGLIIRLMSIRFQNRLLTSL